MDTHNPKKLFLFLVLYFQIKNILSTGGFPKGFLNDITESAVVQERLLSRWKWEVWDVVPGTHTYNIYVFNVTNPVEVEQGAKPILQEMGPYAYVEHRTKFDISVNMDLTVNWQRNFTYTFDSALSTGTEDDIVTVLNVPFIIFSSWASKKGSIGNDAVNSLVAKGEGLLKRNVRIGDFLFDGMDIGIYTQYIPMLQRPSSPMLSEFEFGKYGVLKLKRGANEGPFTVDSGLKERSNTGEIITWKGNTNIPTWYGNSCDAINGTDGTVLPPYVSNVDPIQILDVDLCRSIDFLYDHASTFESIVPTYAFTLDSKILSDPRKDESNLCFCKNPGTNAENCLKGGVLDVSSCKDDTPFVMSFAHFYEADPSYIDGVEGIHPNALRDKSQMTVQPRLGVVVEYLRRFQWNMKIQKYSTLDYFRNAKFQTLLFPIFVNDDNFMLNSDKADLMVSEIANEMGGYGSKGMMLTTELTITTLLSAFAFIFFL